MNDDFGCLFPLCTLIHNRDLTKVSLVGITTRRAESIVRYYELVTAPSHIHTYIHTYRCSHASLLARISYVHDYKGAYTRAYATIHDKLIVNP